MKKILSLILLLTTLNCMGANPVSQLVNRIDASAESKFLFELEDQTSEEDFFVLGRKNGKINIRGNNWLSVATGLNWYLKYHSGVHITWNNPKQRLLNLPKIKTEERHSTKMLQRFYFNYCTFSYSMPFWDWKRWQQEIDFMALHGINMPLMLTGTANVWRNTLLRLGYTKEQADNFIAGPAHQAWFLMNNLEGFGGPNPESWYENQEKLTKNIVAEYDKWNIKPVFAGYGGMVPSNADKMLGLNIQDPGKWNGFQRPAFLQPTDPRFQEIANVYYEEMEKLFGKARYYAIDPFHEGGSTQGVDLKKAGQAIHKAMKKASPDATWVIQSWQANPRDKMIDGLPTSDVIALDLFSESRPQWGDPNSTWYRQDGFLYHDWIYCMLLNFGGNTGMYGKMQRVIDGYFLAQKEYLGRNMKGVGATMEGIENNPVMYELLFELPWHKETFTKEQWMERFVKARYGRTLPQSIEAWDIIANTAYNPPYNATQEGTSEAIIAARPSLEVNRVSTWATSEPYYKADSLLKALKLMCSVSDKYRGCNNFEYDIADLARQCNADFAYNILAKLRESFDQGDSTKFKVLSDKFLNTVLNHDEIVSSRKEFMLGPWIESAMKMGYGEEEQKYFREQALTIITVWGDHNAANAGGLHDYSFREWGGLVKDLYYQRWKMFFDYVNKYKELPLNYDYFPMEQDFTKGQKPYPLRPTTDPIKMAKQTLTIIQQNQTLLK